MSPINNTTMDVENKKTDWMVYSYILLASIASIIIFPVILKPLDNDIFYHMLVAREMIEQKLPIVEVTWFDSPGGLLQHKYPPLFHWILVLFSLGGLIDFQTIAVFLQIIFYPLGLVASYLLISQMSDKKTGCTAIFILTLFFPFFGRTHMAIPEALQHVLIPLTFLSYLKTKEKASGILMTLMLSNHLIDSLFVFVTIMIHWFCYRRNVFKISIFLFLSLPGLFLQCYGIYGFFKLESVRSSYSAYDVIFKVSSRVTRMVHAIACSFIMLILGIWALGKKTMDRNHFILVIWVFFHVIIFFKLPNRFPAYIGLPLSIFLARHIKKLIEMKTTAKYFSLVIIAVLLMTNIYSSYRWFPHILDFRKPGIDKNEALALSWIKTNIPLVEKIGVNQRRSAFEGYRIAYFTRHRVTESKNEAGYLYSIISLEPDSEWKLLKQFDRYRIYVKNPDGIFNQNEGG